MASLPLLDLASIDLTATLHTHAQIYQRLPHRHEFMLLDSICHVDLERRESVARVLVREGDWWTRGHVPRRAIYPGVLMLEAAAQATAYLAKLLTDTDAFLAYGGVDGCKFREAVSPPATLFILSRLTELRSRRFTAQTQGIVDGRLVFEAAISGLSLRD